VRLAASAIVLFAALLLLPGLGRMRAMENTDARYLEVSRAMYASGDWLVPRLAGHPHLDKPPLTYWAAALGYAAVGVTPLAGRLLEQLALSGTALLVMLGSRRLCGWEAAFSAALVFLTFALPFVVSRGLSTDLFQLLFFSGAMLAFLRGVQDRGEPAAVALAFLLLGASMNAKGPIALFVAAAVWLPFLALTRGRTHLSGRALALGLVLFTLVGAPWYMALGLRDPDVLRFWLGTQLLGRVTGAAHGIYHSHGPFYLLGAWPLVLLPWTPLVGLALWRLRPRRGFRSADAVDLYLLLWAIVPVLFFSIPRSKIVTYLLPGFPAAALAIARAHEKELPTDRGARRALLACAGLACTLALVLAAVLLWPSWIRSSRFQTDLLIGRQPFAAGLLTVAALGASGIRRFARGEASLGSGVLVAALGTSLVFVLGFNALAPGFASWREEGLVARSVPGAWLLDYGVDRVSALFYFGSVERFESTRTLEQQRRHPPRGPELEAPAEAGIALMRGEEPVFAITKERFASELIDATGAVIVRRRPGWVLLANRAAQQALASPRKGR